MKKPTRYEMERRSLKHRPRKVLNLEERVLAIRLYQRNPIYQRVASVFKCSWEQIRNIIANRDEIIEYYGRCQTIDANDPPHYVRNKKINFLGHVAYEFIRRAHYHRSAPLNDETLRKCAFEIRDALKIDQFYPNKAWIVDFKKVYNVDWSKLHSLVIGENPPKTLDVKEIVEHCRQMVERMLAMSGEVMERTSKRADRGDLGDMLRDDDDDDGLEEMDANDNDERQSDNSAGSAADFFMGDNSIDNDVRVVHENDDFSGTYEYTDDLLNVNNNDECDNFSDYNAGEIPATVNAYGKTVAATNAKKDDKVERITDALSPTQMLSEVQIKQERCSPCPSPSRLTPQPLSTLTIASVSSTNDAVMIPLTLPVSTTSTPSLPAVSNYSEALQHLGPLEDFAAHAEDFHALNLLMQLVQLCEKGVKREKQQKQEQRQQQQQTRRRMQHQ